jgi:hypothetical protein
MGLPPFARKRGKSRIHDSGKGTTRYMLASAREFRDEPGSLLPECSSECARCPVEALRQKLAKISSLSGNRSALDWATRWGTDLERAYASMVILADEEEIQAVANVCLDGKVVSYAVRGHPPALAVAGLLNWDDPEVRLLAYRKTARKMGINLYSTSERLVCTGSRQKPPKDFIAEVAEAAGYDGVKCGHKSPAPVKLRISFQGGHAFEFCESCAMSKGSFARAYASRSCEKKPLCDASFTFVLEPECDSCGGDCISKVSADVDRRTLGLYLSGRLTDAKLMEGARNSLLSRLEPGTVIAGGSCLGKGPARAVAALAAESMERKALESALDGLDRPLLVDSLTTNKVLAAVWAERGEDVLREAGGDGALKLFDPADGQPMNTVKQAASKARRATTDAALPTYSSLGPCGALADGAARAYKHGGQSDASEFLDRQKTLAHRENAVALAFYIAMGQESNRLWKYGSEEKELGASLAPLAKQLLGATGQAYDRALREILRMSGSGEELA